VSNAAADLIEFQSWRNLQRNFKLPSILKG